MEAKPPPHFVLPRHSQGDEHHWRPSLYMPPRIFRQRLDILDRGGYSVVPLGEGLRRLRTNDLPPRSVAITFDDGGYNFYSEAFPILKGYQFPVTVYQTTYYSEYQKPVFNLICSYMLWKRRGSVLQVGKELGLSEPLDLRTENSRNKIVRDMVLGSEANNLTGVAKNDLAARLAELLDIPYDQLEAKRMFQLMNRYEREELAAQGVDFQLHTHRHRTPINEILFRKEIQDNRRSLHSDEAIHFCYPSGVYRPEFLPWLQAEGVVSATTCDSGLATSRTNALLLPRLVDASARSPIEFEAWLAGVPCLLGFRKTALQIIPAAAGRSSQTGP